MVIQHHLHQHLILHLEDGVAEEKRVAEGVAGVEPRQHQPPLLLKPHRQLEIFSHRRAGMTANDIVKLL